MQLRDARLGPPRQIVLTANTTHLSRSSLPFHRSLSLTRATMTIRLVFKRPRQD